MLGMDRQPPYLGRMTSFHDGRPTATPIAFCHSYASLPERFHRAVLPTPVSAPRLLKLNLPLAEELGLAVSGLSDTEVAAIFSGNSLPPASRPIAMAYAGHQFGQFVPQLGDGRAILIGEAVDRNGERRDIQLKGAGPTPFSRRGDGRAALGPVLREYLVSEAMHQLGIPTTRALAAVLTGDNVYREDAVPGAILTRVARGHVRIGTFQYFAARDDSEGVRALADYVIARHDPELKDRDRRHLALLGAIVNRQASLIASWMCIGFVHGVMNTDNMTVSGETIDYGPCAFLDTYDPAAVFSSIDHGGRYAFGNQPAVAQWNLARLAECLLPLIDSDQDKAVRAATETVLTFGPRFEQFWLAGMRRKLGLSRGRDGDRELVDGFLGILYRTKADYTISFRALCDAAAGNAGELHSIFGNDVEAVEWLARWQARFAEEAAALPDRIRAMTAANPAFIPRNHQIEAVIRAAVDDGSFDPFHALCDVLATPFADQPGRERYALPPQPEERVLQTFCGT